MRTQRFKPRPYHIFKVKIKTVESRKQILISERSEKMVIKCSVLYDLINFGLIFLWSSFVYFDTN